MKAARLHSVGDVRLHDELMPVPNADETLVRVKAVGLCGSDIHWFSEGAIGEARLGKPFVLGHEFAGVTDAGVRVAVDPAVPCDQCTECREGNPNLCTFQHFAGYDSFDGSLREWVAWKTSSLVPIPDALSDADGAMLEPLGIAMHAVDLGKLKTGMRAGIFGCGPIGQLVLQVARCAGAADIFVTEPLPHRLDAALKFGARVWDGQAPVDVAFECAGVQDAVDDAVEAVKPGGRVVLVGIPSGDHIAFNASVARRKELTIKIARRMKHTYARAIRLVESGRVDVRSMVTHRFPLQDISEAFLLAQRREGLKVMIEI